jgi:RNA polymerase sigma factor (TIGR02999 family)
MAAPPDVTLLLANWSRGDRAALDQLLPLVYAELRRIAARQLRSERADHTLQPTALVNEAYMRLVAHEHHNWRNRAHFFGAAAELMRRILVDHARAAQAAKRGGGQIAQADASELVIDSPSIEILALDRALDELARIAPRQARIVELRYFGGLSVPETAEALGLNARTVDRDWAAARVWLRRRLRP